ncbi:MAG: N-6 DNA methylase [Candidatus Limivivens sp.]|nr:N-6 DNA methylase [Candidatus Limivivens sp.]
MDEKWKEKYAKTEALEGILREYKTVMDFYRMDYSDDLTALFHDTGYLLLCELSEAGYFACRSFGREQAVEDEAVSEVRKAMQSLEDRSSEEILAYAESLEREFQRRTEQDPRFEKLQDFKIGIRKSSLLRQIFQVLEKLFGLEQKFQEPRVFYEVLRKIHELCANTRNDRSRYVLPERIVEQVARLLEAGMEENGEDRPVSIFDPQYGSGELLLDAGEFFKNAGLYGHEEEPGLRLSARILCLVSGAVIREEEEDFPEKEPGRRYQIVLANPPFGRESVPYAPSDLILPGGLRYLKEKYHLCLVRSLQALELNGSAALVVPESFLFSSTKESRAVREWILNTYDVEMILSLPEKTFYPRAAVRTAILLIRNPFMKSGWSERTEQVLFCRLQEKENGGEGEERETGERETAKSLEELLRVQSQRDYYFRRWQEELSRGFENFNGIRTPENWEFPHFWFADYRTIQDAGWNLLPDYYRPAGRLELRFEDPVQLLRELMEEQEQILKDMRELLEEVQRL